MRYVCLVYGDERAFAGRSDCEGFDEPLIANGRLLASSRLQPVGSAATVRLRGGKALVTDGPFAETKEQLLGFVAIEAESLEEAVEIAFRHPAAREGCIEVRPVADLSVGMGVRAGA